MRTISDQELVAIIIQGDVEAYAEIISRYESKLTRYVTYLTHNSNLTTDIVQNTFIKAYQNLHSFNPRSTSSLHGYTGLHTTKRYAVKQTRFIGDDDVNELPDKQYDHRIAEVVDSDILKKHVRACLSQLEPKYREVIQLVYFENLKYGEISDVLHVPIETVGV